MKPLRACSLAALGILLGVGAVAAQGAPDGPPPLQPPSGTADDPGTAPPTQRDDLAAVRDAGPPATQPQEEIGPPPGPGTFYIAGSYVPEGSRVVWKPGFWAQARPGWEWVPARWVRRSEGWTFRQGYWSRAREDDEVARASDPVPPPTPLAPGRGPLFSEPIGPAGRHVVARPASGTGDPPRDNVPDARAGDLKSSAPELEPVPETNSPAADRRVGTMPPLPAVSPPDVSAPAPGDVRTPPVTRNPASPPALEPVPGTLPPAASRRVGRVGTLPPLPGMSPPGPGVASPSAPVAAAGDDRTPPATLDPAPTPDLEPIPEARPPAADRRIGGGGSMPPLPGVSPPDVSTAAPGDDRTPPSTRSPAPAPDLQPIPEANPPASDRRVGRVGTLPAPPGVASPGAGVAFPDARVVAPRASSAAPGAPAAAPGVSTAVPSAPPVAPGDDRTPPADRDPGATQEVAPVSPYGPARLPVPYWDGATLVVPSTRFSAGVIVPTAPQVIGNRLYYPPVGLVPPGGYGPYGPPPLRGPRGGVIPGMVGGLFGRRRP